MVCMFHWLDTTLNYTWHLFNLGLSMCSSKNEKEKNITPSEQKIPHSRNNSKIPHPRNNSKSNRKLEETATKSIP
jgi:hypothetical protein